MKVYAFLYNDCIHESAWATVSLHFSRNGAKKALKNHMAQKFIEYKNYKNWCINEGLDRPRFGWREDWRIGEEEVL